MAAPSARSRTRCSSMQFGVGKKWSERKGAVKKDGRDSRFLCHCAAESGFPLLLDEKNGCIATYVASSTSLFLSVIWNEKRRFPPFLFRCTPHPNGGLISLPSFLPSFCQPSSFPHSVHAHPIVASQR